MQKQASLWSKLKISSSSQAKPRSGWLSLQARPSQLGLLPSLCPAFFVSNFHFPLSSPRRSRWRAATKRTSPPAGRSFPCFHHGQERSGATANQSGGLHGPVGNCLSAAVALPGPHHPCHATPSRHSLTLAAPKPHHAENATSVVILRRGTKADGSVPTASHETTAEAAISFSTAQSAPFSPADPAAFTPISWCNGSRR